MKPSEVRELIIKAAKAYELEPEYVDGSSDVAVLLQDFLYAVDGFNTFGTKYLPNLYNAKRGTIKLHDDVEGWINAMGEVDERVEPYGPLVDVVNSILAAYGSLSVLLTDSDGCEITAALTVDSPSSSYRKPVLAKDDNTEYGPGDLYNSGTRQLWPDDDMTEDAERMISAFWSQLPGAVWCRRCGWVWVRRGINKPGRCPNCSSGQWESIRTGNEPGPKPKR